MTFDEFDPLLIVVGRQEVSAVDTSWPLSSLKHLLASQKMVQDFRTRVGLLFEGYNETGEELWEIPKTHSHLRIKIVRLPASA